MRTIEMSPIYDARKSFYGKAEIRYNDDNSKDLLSYGYNVCTIANGTAEIHTDIEKWDSQTTLRHIREFLAQNGFSTGTKAQLVKMYA